MNDLNNKAPKTVKKSTAILLRIASIVFMLLTFVFIKAPLLNYCDGGCGADYDMSKNGSFEWKSVYDDVADSDVKAFTIAISPLILIFGVFMGLLSIVQDPVITLLFYAGIFFAIFVPIKVFAKTRKYLKKPANS